MNKLILCTILCLAATTAWAQENYLYVVDVGTNRQPPQQVLRYDEDGSNPQVFINTQLANPQEVIFLEEQGLAIVSNLNGNNITSYDAETGEFRGVWASGISQPTRMKFGPDGFLYVLQWAGNGQVLRFDRNGNSQGAFTSVGVTQSIGLDWDAQGNLYVAGFANGLVRRFDTNGNDQGVFINAGLNGPTNIWFQPNGEMMVLDWSANSIKRFDSSGNFIATTASAPEPEGVQLLDNGGFLIGAGGSGLGTVRQYDSNGSFVTNIVAPGFGGLRKPNGLTFRAIPNQEPEFTINAGLNDAWFNIATQGQGAFVTVFPDIGAIFVAVFTYDTERPADDVTAMLGEPGHRWFTAFGDFEGDSAVLDIELTQGGVFDMAMPTVTQTSGYGTLTVQFSDCENMLLIYDFPSLNLTGQIPMTRIAADNIPRCEALANGE